MHMPLVFWAKTKESGEKLFTYYTFTLIQTFDRSYIIHNLIPYLYS